MPAHKKSTRARLTLAAVVAATTLCVIAATATTAVSAGPAIELRAARGITLDRPSAAGGAGGDDSGEYYGTRGVILRGSVQSYTASTSGKGYAGTTVFIPCAEHLNKAALTELSGSSSGGGVSVNGLIVALCEEDSGNEELLSLYFAGGSVDFPVYFVERNSAATTTTTVAQVAPDAATIEKLLTDHTGLAEYVVVTAGRTGRGSGAYTNATVPAYALHSTIALRPREAKEGSTGKRCGKGLVDGGGNTGPRILITANVDSFGVAPSSHTTGGVSGAVAAVEVYRRQAASAAAAVATTAGGGGASAPFGVSMLISTTARFNYAATDAWLLKRSDADIMAYKLVISLDDLLPTSASVDGGKADGDDNTVYMHVQDTFKRRGDGKLVIDLATAAAAAHGLELKVQPAKTNYQHYDVRHEHEIFANRQVPAVTFSSHRTQTADQILRGTRRPVDDKAVAALARRVDFISAFVDALLEKGTATTDSGSEKRVWAGAESYMAGLLRSAAQTIRCPLAHEGKPLRAYVDLLNRHIGQIDATTRTAAGTSTTATTGGNSGLALSIATTMEDLRVAPSGVLVYGPYEETIKLFVARRTPVELFSFGVAAGLVVAFGIVEFGFVGFKKVIVGY